jgi:1-acyl-sn-glycerol-3-phosphate acyltransferase
VLRARSGLRALAAVPRQKAPPWLRACLVTIYPMVPVFFRREVRHPERLVAPGPAIIVANHVSHVDPILLGTVVWDAGFRPRFLAKAGLFATPVIRLAIKGSGQVPVVRGTADAAQSLQAAVDVLAAGDRIIIYPEGTVTRDPQGLPMAGRSGAARLAALMPEVPVIPIGQWGARESVDIYAKRIRLRPRRRVVYTVGEPIDLRPVLGGSANPGVDELHRATDVIMARLTELAVQSRDAR